VLSVYVGVGRPERLSFVEIDVTRVLLCPLGRRHWDLLYLLTTAVEWLVARARVTFTRTLHLVGEGSSLGLQSGDLVAGE